MNLLVRAESIAQKEIENLFCVKNHDCKINYSALPHIQPCRKDADTNVPFFESEQECCIVNHLVIELDKCDVYSEGLPMPTSSI